MNDIITYCIVECSILDIVVESKYFFIHCRQYLHICYCCNAYIKITSIYVYSNIDLTLDMSIMFCYFLLNNFFTNVRVCELTHFLDFCNYQHLN